MRRRRRQKAAIIDYNESHAFDEDGEPLTGFYWQLLDDSENPITGEMGPYATYHECYAAMDLAYQKHDY